MHFSETNTTGNYGILPICPVDDCINYIVKIKEEWFMNVVNLNIMKHYVHVNIIKNQWKNDKEKNNGKQSK